MEIKTVSEVSELEGIKNLQEQNLKFNLDKKELEEEGFVTAEYTIDFLKAMHDEYPSIIAKADGLVVGYALVTTKSVAHLHKLLGELFDTIDTIEYRGELLKNSKYIVVGQLCVAKGYRGMGLAQKMYNEFRERLSGEFDYCITDVDEGNPRSLHAHLKAGFTVIDNLTYSGTRWSIVLWDWKNLKVKS